MRLREAKGLPPPPAALESPSEVDARFGTKGGRSRFGTKGGRSWPGSTVPRTETCDGALPHWVTQVHTPAAPAHDVAQRAAIQAARAQRARRPGQRLVAAGSARARTPVGSPARGVELVGPIPDDRQRQAQAPDAFAGTQVRLAWDARVVACPPGPPSRARTEAHARARERDVVNAVKVSLAKETCLPCPGRDRCTRSAQHVRTLTPHHRAEHEAVQAARQWQQTDAFAAPYALRAGAQGTRSQAVRRCGMRRARYRGLAKTHPQPAAAAALDLARLAAGLAGEALAPTA